MPAVAEAWRRIITLPDGHRLFLSPSSDQVAITDESGPTPGTTDDGILFLDRSRDLSIDGYGRCFVPVQAPDGSRAVTVTNLQSLFLLGHEYAWPIRTPGQARYRTEKIR